MMETEKRAVERQHEARRCPVCQIERATTALRSGAALPAAIAQIIADEHPGWTVGDAVCDSCVQQAEATHMQTLLKSKLGELSSLERTVVESIRAGDLLTANTEHAFEEKLTALDRFADGVAALASSWYFAAALSLGLILWITVNLLWQPFEPYPAIIMAVIGATFASVAALQGPIILMVQKRQRQRDRLQAEHDYLVNLKAELEIRSLHEKLDAMLARQSAAMGGPLPNEERL
ncbi:MAG: DUF1003 domain-containing protein [Caldilineaceae bacterium]|nr:DUF1003 domain-containing protein [Caldilineaceae bacterium]